MEALRGPEFSLVSQRIELKKTDNPLCRTYDRLNTSGPFNGVIADMPFVLVRVPPHRRNWSSKLSLNAHYQLFYPLASNDNNIANYLSSFHQLQNFNVFAFQYTLKIHISVMRIALKFAYFDFMEISNAIFIVVQNLSRPTSPDNRVSIVSLINVSGVSPARAPM